MWRLQTTQKKAGTYYVLARGSRADRVSISLGYITPEEASSALKRANVDPDKTERVRLLALASQERAKADPEAGIIDARGWLLDPDADVDALFGEAPPDYSRMTLKEFAETVFMPSRQARVAPGTWEREVVRLPTITDADIGSVEIRHLNPQRWERHLATRADKAPRTRKLEENLYREILKEAVFLGAISNVHPFRRIKGSSKRVRDITPLTPDEVTRLLDACSVKHRAMFGLGIGVGLRPAELVNVHWQDIDWDRRLLKVRGTKTDTSAATIPLTDFAVREIQAWWVAQGQPKTGRCFTRAGKPILRYEQPLETAAIKAGLVESETYTDASGRTVIRIAPGQRRIHPNMFRHTFISLAAHHGIPLKVCQAITRHTTTAMILEVYAQAGRDMITEGLDRFPL